MILYGASGHSKVIIDCLEESNVAILGIFDDDDEKKEVLQYEVLGKYSVDLLPEHEIVIAIGNNQIRSKLLREVKHKFGKVLHPSAIVQKNVVIGEGSVVFHHAVIQASTKIGKHVIINTKASVDHDCVIGDLVHIAPNATLCGGITVGEGTLVGAGAVILPNIKIGKWSIIAAGTVVINDIPDNVLVAGNPGKTKKNI